MRIGKRNKQELYRTGTASPMVPRGFQPDVSPLGPTRALTDGSILCT